MIRQVRIAGYRSIRELSLPLGQVNVVVGVNGSGKSNLYNALRLVARAARGGLARAIVAEGGLPSVLWAGEPRRNTRSRRPVRLAVGVVTDGMSYAFACGMPPPVPPSVFDQDPEVKEEFVWVGERRRPSTTLLERLAGSAWVTDAAGARTAYPLSLDANESVLAQLAEPHLYPELSALRVELAGYRFYHQFDTGPAAALRAPRVGVRTPVLDDDGSHLAAALWTIREVGDAGALADAVADAFGGARLELYADRGVFSLALPHIRRPLAAAELSDGTLRYLCLVAALLSPRPARFLVFNEPESSLHERLLPPLASLFAAAAARSQLLLTTHARVLADAIAEQTECRRVDLELRAGRTVVACGERWLDED
jgi:predicted ATPase